jgi:hypothetical protein
MKFDEFANFIEGISKIRSRNEVSSKLSDTFKQLDKEELPIFIEFLIARKEKKNFRKGINIGWATVYEVINDFYGR